MIDNDTQQAIDSALREHEHNGNFSRRVNFYDIFGYFRSTNVISQTIGTAAANYDAYMIVPISGSVSEVNFSGLDALAASNTNYITWTITNLGQAGAGTAVMLDAVDANTTKLTGGTALAANTKRTLTLSTTPNNTNVVQGDRLRIRAAVTGTLANTVTFPVYLIQIQTQ